MPEEENPTLRSAVEKAASEQGIVENSRESVNNEQDSKKPDQKPDDEDQTISETNNKNEEYTPDPELEEAVNFYRALRDPKQQTDIITALARRAGLLQPNEQPTKIEEKKYGDLLGEILGEEYPDLKDKLGKVFKAFELESDKKLNSLKEQLDSERREKAANDFETEFSNFITTNKITETDATKMLKEIEVLPPSTGRNGKKISLTDYLGKIHRLVAGDKKVVDTEVQRAKKIQENLRERSKNLSSDISDERLRKGSALPSIKESIKAASEGIEFDKE